MSCFCKYRSKMFPKPWQNHGYTINVKSHFSPLWPTELPPNGCPYMLNANMYGLCRAILTATAHGNKYVNRRLECKFWPLLLPTSSHSQTHLCTGPNQTFRRYSQRKAFDYVRQLRLISERIMISATFLYERAFIGMGIEKQQTKAYTESTLNMYARMQFLCTATFCRHAHKNYNEIVRRCLKPN